MYETGRYSKLHFLEQLLLLLEPCLADFRSPEGSYEKPRPATVSMQA